MRQSNSSQTAPSADGDQVSTRDLLVDAAIECVAEKGFAGTTMRQVADRADVTQGPREYYFPSPTDLYKAVVKLIHSRQEHFLSGATKDYSERSNEELLRAVLEPAFKSCGNERHLDTRKNLSL